jgi:hypothetical protein
MEKKVATLEQVPALMQAAHLAIKKLSTASQET